MGFNENQLKLIVENYKEFVDSVKNSYRDAGYHFGQNAGGCRITIATWGWMFNRALKKIEEGSF